MGHKVKVYGACLLGKGANLWGDGECLWGEGESLWGQGESLWGIGEYWWSERPNHAVYDGKRPCSRLVILCNYHER